MYLVVCDPVLVMIMNVPLILKELGVLFHCLQESVGGIPVLCRNHRILISNLSGRNLVCQLTLCV